MKNNIIYWFILTCISGCNFPDTLIDTNEPDLRFTFVETVISNEIVHVEFGIIGFTQAGYFVNIDSIDKTMVFLANQGETIVKFTVKTQNRITGGISNDFQLSDGRKRFLQIDFIVKDFSK